MNENDTNKEVAPNDTILEKIEQAAEAVVEKVEAFFEGGETAEVKAEADITAGTPAPVSETATTVEQAAPVTTTPAA